MLVVFDANAMLKNFSGYRSIADAMLESLQSDLPERMLALAAALAAADLATAQREAHTVKGLGGNGGAPRLRDLALEIESCCGAGRLDDARQRLADLTAEAGCVLQEWRRFLAGDDQ